MCTHRILFLLCSDFAFWTLNIFYSITVLWSWWHIHIKFCFNFDIKARIIGSRCAFTACSLMYSNFRRYQHLIGVVQRIRILILSRTPIVFNFSGLILILILIVLSWVLWCHIISRLLLHNYRLKWLIFLAQTKTHTGVRNRRDWLFRLRHLTWCTRLLTSA